MRKGEVRNLDLWKQSTKANYSKKYQKVQDAFKELHEVKRLRFDDCITELAETFSLSSQSIMRILRMNLGNVQA